MNEDSEGSEGAHPYPCIRCELSCESEYLVGAPVLVEFSLRNESSEPIAILRWCTPLEGFTCDMFDLRRDGEPVRYCGILAKRGDPMASEYVIVEPSECLDVVFDMREGYEVDEIGRYHARYRTRVHDWAFSHEAVPRTRNLHRSYDLDCGALTWSVVG